MKNFPILICLFLYISFSSCSVVVNHPMKGESKFDSHRPTEQMSKSFIDDLNPCRRWANQKMIESGLKIYRNQSQTIKECLKGKGWVFTP